MATKQDRFPKKFLNAKAVKDKPQVLVIEQEQLEDITDPKTGKTQAKPVVSFEGTETRLILNAINFDLICEATGETDSARWPGHEIELFCDRTSIGSERVDCIRVRVPGSGQSEKKTKAALAETLADEMDDEIPFA